MADRRTIPLRRNRFAPLAGIIGAVVLVALGGTYVATGASRPGSDSLRTTQVSRGLVEQSLTLTGSVTRVNQLTVAFPVTGTVRSVDVVVGQRVEAGQPLASMVTTALQQSVLDAQAQYDQAVATESADLAAGVSSASSSSGSAASNSGASGATTTRPAAGAAGVPSPNTALDAVTRSQTTAQQTCAPVLATASRPAVPATSAAPTTTASVTSTSTATSTTTATATTTSTVTTTATSTGGATGPTVQQMRDCAAALQAVTVAQQAASRALQSYAQALTQQAAQLAQQAATLQQQAAAARAATTARAAGGGVSEAKLITDRANVVSGEAALAKAKANLAGATLSAPAAGVVGVIPWQAGDTASLGAGIQIIGSGAARVTVQVPQTSLASIQVGQVAHVSIVGQAPIDGTVSQIALLPTSGTSGSPTYAVEVMVAGLPDEAGTGGRATVSIVVRQAANVLTVPASAVLATGPGAGLVGLVNAGQVQQVSVQTGAVGGGRVEILNGVGAGDTVLVGDAAQPLPTNNGGIGGLLGGGGGNVRIPGQPGSQQGGQQPQQPGR